MGLVLRRATPDDAPTVLGFIKDLAAYERSPDSVAATPDVLRAQLAELHPPFEALLAELDGEAAGLALYFHSYSTWRGRRGIYLEDLFVRPELRGRGIGKALFREVARTAMARDCARLEFTVIDWNEPAIAFYRALGAEPIVGWTVFRLAGEPLAELGQP